MQILSNIYHYCKKHPVKLLDVFLLGLVLISIYHWSIHRDSSRAISTQSIITAEIKGEQIANSDCNSRDRTMSCPYEVLSVVDGDTIILESNERVRYIGIDTPETVHPEKPVECFGKEASDYNRGLIWGKKVYLEKDLTDRDQYGRLLRYVYVLDGQGRRIFVNLELVKQGYAQVATYPPDVKHQDEFLQAQEEARQLNQGLWGNCR